MQQKITISCFLRALILAGVACGASALMHAAWPEMTPVPLDADRGGVVIPASAEWLHPRRGTVLLELRLTYFPSNGTVLDLGDGTQKNHIAIMEKYEGDGTTRQGRFRLHVHDSRGRQHVLTSEVSGCDRAAILAFSYNNDTVDFWVDGAKVGSIACPLDLTNPDRLALVEPLGVRWSKIKISEQAFDETRLQKATASGDWEVDAATTFVSRRDAGAAKTASALGRSYKNDAATLRALLNTAPPSVTLHVDGAAGDDAGDGSETRPFRTLARAVAAVRPGTTVLVAPGIYRESVNLSKGGRKNAPIRFQASARGKVVLDGTDIISGFIFSRAENGADIWIKPGYKTRDVPFGDRRLIDILTSRGPTGVAQLERRGRRDAIWLDSQRLPHAESRAALAPKSFWVDREKDELHLALRPGDRPEAHLVEAGARDTFFGGGISHVEVRGFTLSRANSRAMSGAFDLTPAASDWVIEDNTVTEGNFAGIYIRGWNHVLRGNIFEKNRSEGIGGTLCQYAVLEDNVVRQNNWHGINPNWSGGGGKLTQSHHIEVRRQVAAFNNGPGIWFDIGNADILIENCTAYDNTDGIFVEISHGPAVIRNNVCFRNHEGGISIGESGNVEVSHNTCVLNEFGIELRNISGRSGLGLGVGSDDVNWKVKNIKISHNVLVENTKAGLANTFAAIDPKRDNIQSDHNLFYENNIMLLWKQPEESAARINDAGDWVVPPAGGGLPLASLPEVRAALGLERHSVSADPRFKFPKTHEYEPAPDGPAAGDLRAGHTFGKQ